VAGLKANLTRQTYDGGEKRHSEKNPGHSGIGAPVVGDSPASRHDVPRRWQYA